MPITSGDILSCSNPDCGCKITILKPCPHGEDYKCACGHDLKSL